MIEKTVSSIAAALVVTALATGQSPPAARRVAVTVDDGPVVAGLTDLGNLQRIARGLLSSLGAEKIPAAIFINERRLNVPCTQSLRREGITES